MNHCKTITIVNQKGGVGKTTSTVNLGVGLAQAGNRVLLVDDDPQHSLTISLGIRNADEDLDITLATAMQAEIRDESVPWEEGIIHSSEGVDLLPANIELSGVEMSLFNAMSREQVLKSVLSRVKENYNYILIDCMDKKTAICQALLKSPCPLSDVFQAWEKCESSHMEELWSTVEDRANTVIQTAKAKSHREER